MDTLITALLVGFAASFVVETLVDWFDTWISSRWIRHTLTFPLSLLACWQLGLFGPTLFVAALAAGFFSLTASKLANKVSVNNIAQVVNRRSL